MVNNGVQSPLLLQNVLDTYQLTPYDIKHLTQTCLSPAQFLHFDVKLKTLVLEQAHKNRIGPNPCPTINEEIFSGTGIWGPPPKGTVGIVLGKADLNLKGITIMPSVLDGDCRDEIQVLTCAIDM